MAEARPKPVTELRRIAARLRARGPGEVGRFALDRIGEIVSSRDSLLMYNRAAGPGSPERTDLRVLEATSADGPRYARLIGTESPATFAARLTRSTSCWLVELDDRLVHSSWTTTKAAWTREIGALLTPPHGDAYIYESYTRPEMRGRGVYPFALAAIAARSFERDLRTVWVAVEAHNRASIRAVEKAGFAEAFEIDFARRFGRVRLGVPRGPRADAAATFLQRG